MSSTLDESSSVYLPSVSPSQGGIFREILRSRGFVICLVMLCVFAAVFHGWQSASGQRLVKEAIPLKLPLDELDHKTKLGHYRFLKATPIQADVLNTLGTEQYIQWMLQDTRPELRHRPEGLIHCFVTYYTGMRDQVPHVPEECYKASGYNAVDDEILDIPIPALGENVVIPVKLLEMERSTFLGVNRCYVMYTFSANNTFRADRRGVQSVVTDPFSHHAYFSKVELTFGVEEAKVSREEAIRSGSDFLNVFIPVLVQDHWPDWEAAESAVSGKSGESEGTESEISPEEAAS